MGWLRDNWLDALVFLLFVIVVVGIILFLTGVNPFRRGSTSLQSIPGSSSSAAAATSQPVAGPTVSPTGPSAGISVLPLPAVTSSGTAGVSVKSPAVPKPVTPAVVASVAPKPAAAAPRMSVPASGVFRVAVGAFANAANALRLMRKLRGGGYPVRLEPVGRITRVVVGPYTSRASAEVTLNKLADYEPQLYQGSYRPTSDIYLQVGAYKDFGQLGGLFNSLNKDKYPFVLAYDGNLLKVWVGPYKGNALKITQASLDRMGLPSLEVH